MRSAVLLVTGAVAVMALSGCSLIDGSARTPSTAPEPPPPASASAPSSPAPSSPEPSDSPTGSPADPGSAPPSGNPSQTPGDLGPVVGTRTSSSSGGTRIELRLHQLTREGSLSHLNLTISTDSTKNYQVAGLLSDGNSEAGDASAWAADGITLEDGTHRKLYLVASDGQGTCLCTRDLSSVFLSDSEPFVVSATFAAPPPDITTVDVRIPGFGVFTRVPVS